MRVHADVLIRAMSDACCSSNQLKEMAGISESTLYRMKNNGSVRPDSIGKVRKVLDIPYEEFVVKE